jgi:hypothetical protein
MPIDTPANRAVEAHRDAMRREAERERSREARESFGEQLREGFGAKAAKRRERQEAAGIPTKAPTVTPAIAAAEREATEARRLADEARSAGS